MVVGTHNDLFKSSLVSDVINQNTDLLDISVTFLYNGVDWLYTYVETVFSYDFKVWYFLFSNSIFDESFDIFFIIQWWSSLIVDSFTLIPNYFLDSYLFKQVILANYDDHWYRTMLSSRDVGLAAIFHPELSLVSYQNSNNLFNKTLGSYYTFINELVESEGIITPSVTFFQFMVFLLIVSLFLNVYFSFFSSSVKEEVTIDYDYLVASSSVEAEKEITSFDDVVLGMITVLFMIGWYFYMHCWTLISNSPELILFFYLLPALYGLILGIPASLIYDFGILFLAYLRGVGATPIILYELMFDYINIIIFFTRILVQGVRIILMVFTYASMHDYILYFCHSPANFLQYETFWEEITSVSLSATSLSYFMVVVVPNRLIYWMYEVLHTFFVVTAQCTAFFAIVFWLFLFLYTFFVIEKQEDYFSVKRSSLRAKIKKF